MARILPLPQAVAELVHDGDTVAMEGSGSLVPVEAGREIIRQARRDLVLVCTTPDIVCDQLVGAGCVGALVSSRTDAADGPLHRVQEALAEGSLEIDEHSRAGMVNRYLAGASGLPFAVLRGYAGTDIPLHSATVATVTCPFTGEVLPAVAALEPDVAIVHAQRADRAGNVAFWGDAGLLKEAVLAAGRALVTVEELVDELAPGPDAVVLPTQVLAAVAVVPGGATPSAVPGHYGRDDAAYREWDAISRDRTRFRQWLDELRAAA